MAKASDQLARPPLIETAEVLVAVLPGQPPIPGRAGLG